MGKMMAQNNRMSPPAQIGFGAFGGLFAAGAIAWAIASLNIGMRQVVDGLPLLAVIVAVFLMGVTAVRCWWIRSYFPIVLCLLFVAGIGSALLLEQYSGGDADWMVVRLLLILPWAFLGLCLTCTVMSFTVGAAQSNGKQ